MISLRQYGGWFPHTPTDWIEPIIVALWGMAADGSGHIGA